MRTRRNISYLTCTRSRESKNSLVAKASSVTFSGCGCRQPCSRRASALGSLLGLGMGGSPTVCKYDYAVFWHNVKQEMPASDRRGPSHWVYDLVSSLADLPYRKL